MLASTSAKGPKNVTSKWLDPMSVTWHITKVLDRHNKTKNFVSHDLRYCCWDLDINIWHEMHSSTIGPECTGVQCTQHNSFESCMGKYYSKIITHFEKWSYIKRFNWQQSRCGVKRNKFKEIINIWVNYQMPHDGNSKLAAKDFHIKLVSGMLDVHTSI